MIKRATETRTLPDPTSFAEWKDWARQLNLELQRQLLTTSMVLPFFEFGIVERTTNYTMAGVGIPWENKVYDNTVGMWFVANPSRLVIPNRPSGIKYGYAMIIANFVFTDPGGGGPNNIDLEVRKNGVAVMPAAAIQGNYQSGAPGKIGLVQPWTEVNAGDYFEIFATRTGPGSAEIDAHVSTFAELIISGPA